MRRKLGIGRGIRPWVEFSKILQVWNTARTFTEIQENADARTRFVFWI